MKTKKIILCLSIIILLIGCESVEKTNQETGETETVRVVDPRVSETVEAVRETNQQFNPDPAIRTGVELGLMGLAAFLGIWGRRKKRISDTVIDGIDASPPGTTVEHVKDRISEIAMFRGTSKEVDSVIGKKRKARGME